MKQLIEAAKANPQLAEDLKQLKADLQLQVKALADKYSIPIETNALSDEDLDQVGGGFW